MSVNYDKHSVEKRHDQRFLGIFLMFVVLAAVIGLFMAFSAVSAAKGGNPSPGAPTCVDTDGGINYYFKGYCYDSIGNYSDYCTNSTCNEYYCNSKKKCVMTPMNCMNLNGTGVCYDGACQR